MKAKVSVIIITLNEENNIRNCLESVKWVDEILIIDSFSSDNTINIAKEYTGKIISEHDTYASKRNKGFQIASNEWLLWLDADELITEELRDEIIKVIGEDKNETEGYLIGRKTFFINKFIKYSGWYPDRKLRLFRKDAGVKFADQSVHENIIYNFKALNLNNEILHYTDMDFEHYVDKMNHYTELKANELHSKQKNISLFTVFLKPVYKFVQMYILKLGILDGYTGLILCILSGISEHVKYSKLYLLNNNYFKNG